MRFRDKLLRFLSGRYGVDQLWYGLLALYVLLMIAEVILRYTVSGIVGFGLQMGLNILMGGVLVFSLFRIFSRNLSKRRRENERFLSLWQPVKKFFLLQRNKWRDRKTHVYRKCPEKDCGATLRLPKKPGIHTVRCPKCGKPFLTKI